MAKTRVTFEEGAFSIYCSFLDNDRVRNAPQRKYSKTMGWRLPPTIGNARYILRTYEHSEIDATAGEKAEALVASTIRPPITAPIPAKLFDGARPHQREAIERAWAMREHAFLHRMRTGKTFTTIRTAQGRRQQDLIDLLVVFCPMSIKDVWRRQLGWWCQTPHAFYDAHSSNKQTIGKFMTGVPEGALPVVCVAIESMSAGNLSKALAEQLVGLRYMAVVDESTRIKNPAAARTEKIRAIGVDAEFRLILTGSEVTRSPVDLYSQFLFLNEEILGHSSVFSFKNRYCIMGGFEKRKVIAYANLPELFERVGRYSHLVETADVADLPPKEYEVRTVKPSAEQVRLIGELRREMLTSLDGNDLEVTGALALITRAHQINGGMFPFKGEDGKWYSRPLADNPKLDELMDILDEVSGKVVIWCRYRGEITQVVERIRKDYGGKSVVEYHGGLDASARAASERKFAEDPECRFIIANQQTGAMGVDFSSAGLMVYFSNTFNYEDRKQSEERATSVAAANQVLIIDLQLDNATDRGITENLNQKRDIADFVKDQIKNAATLI